MRRFAVLIAMAFLLALALLPAGTAAVAQGVFGPAGATPSGASPTKPAQADKDAPVQIEAATLEVHDKSKTATFSGNVQVVQGDMTMRCRSLIVFYGQEVIGSSGDVTNTTGAKPMLGTQRGAQNIRRIEARGGVTVVTKDQSASGDLGIYDLKAKTITLSGNVVVTQGQNVIHGERVVVETESGNARVESGATGTAGGSPGRVRALIQPGKGQGGGPSNFMTIGPGRPN
jgi:lipopolysaccharide export system protein LptA